VTDPTLRAAGILLEVPLPGEPGWRGDRRRRDVGGETTVVAWARRCLEDLGASDGSQYL